MEHRTRSRWWPGVAPAAAAAVLLGAGASSATAAVPGLQDDQIVVAPLEQIPERADLLAQSRTRVARIDLFWSDVAPTRPLDPRNPADPAYDFERWDRIATALTARGIRPIFAIYSAPSWATGGRGAPAGRHVNPWVPKAGDYGNFVQAVARRYSGSFTDPASGTRLPVVRHLEVWNEPNLAGFLRPQAGGAGLRSYVALAKAAYPAAKRGNPRAVVIVGAVGPRSSTNATGTGALPFSRALIRSKLKMNAFSIHIYPAAAPKARTSAFPAWGTLPAYAAELKKQRPSIPLLITEAGYTTAATPFRKVRVSPAAQALYLKQIFALPVVRQRVGLVVWYQMQDNRDWPGGLRYANGRPKAAWGAFRGLARRGGIPAYLRR